MLSTPWLAAKARFGYQTGYNHKISDMKEFQKFIDQNPGKIINNSLIFTL
ncbi:hypothetical protein [Piscirickettsia salmonis]|nr:hypothetical protein [Piscirickettsia salmonis]QIX57230.1 hypothetical protein GW536_17495 [Piscirickettsia salmonis]